jgi:hypothetical protein
MTNVKQILSENRESVISSIKFVCKVWKSEDVKIKMISFLAYAEQNLNIGEYEATKAKKTYLKNLVCKMEAKQQRENNIRIYGTANPKLADVMAKISEKHEEAGETWNPVTREWN